jgi:hypothetical protein
VQTCCRQWLSGIGVVNFKTDARLHTPLPYSVLHGELKITGENSERVAVDDIKGLPLQPCVSCKLQEVACRLFSFYSFCVGTILRWKLVLKLELLQNTNAPRIQQLRERSHARSRNVYSFQIGRSFLFFFLLSCVTARLYSSQTSVAIG